MSEPVQAWPPTPGHYATTLVKNGPRVAVLIWFGAPIIDGEEQDRSHRWNIEVDGATDRWEKGDDGYRCRVALDIDSFWPWVARDPIEPSEYQYLKAHSAWAKEHAPHHPKAAPRSPVDFHTLPIRF